MSLELVEGSNHERLKLPPFDCSTGSQLRANGYVLRLSRLKLIARVSEALSLKLSQIDLENMLIVSAILILARNNRMIGYHDVLLYARQIRFKKQ